MRMTATHSSWPQSNKHKECPSQTIEGVMRPQGPALKAGGLREAPGGGQRRRFLLSPAVLSAVSGTRGSLLRARPVCHPGYRDYFIHKPRADPEPGNSTEAATPH